MDEQRSRSSHPFAVTVILVVAALVGALAIGAIWANRQLLDTESWVATSGRMLDSSDLRHRVSSFLAEELVDETEGQLGAAGEGEVAGEVLPELRQRAPELAERVLRTSQFRVIWLRANGVAHRALVRVLNEEGVTREGGERMVVDLSPALRDLADSLGRGDLGAYVEPGAARIEVLEADELELAQDLVRVIHEVPVPATIAALALFALALLLGRASLRRTAGAVGLSLAAAGAIALLARFAAGRELADYLLAQQADRDAAEAAWRIATSTVADLGVAAIVLGGLLVLWSVLLGEGGLAVGLRRGLAPFVRTPLARLWVALIVVLAFLVLLLWAPIAALEAPLGIALFALVIGGGAFLFARESALEPAGYGR